MSKTYTQEEVDELLNKQKKELAMRDKILQCSCWTPYWGLTPINTDFTEEETKYFKDNYEELERAGKDRFFDGMSKIRTSFILQPNKKNQV